MKIYTKSGDAGKTALVGGKRVSKTDLRIEAYGTVDELNANLGLAILNTKSPTLLGILNHLQNELFHVGSDLATELDSEFKIKRIGNQHISRLESWIDELDEKLKPLRNFILPGGSAGSSQLHVCRTICRRAERLCCDIETSEVEINSSVIPYLNRLSDLFFVMARFENQHLSIEDVIWKQGSVS
jgi:cob(I)alamin adenosyltransferase